MSALGKSLETLLSRGKTDDSSHSSTGSQSLTHPSILDHQHRYVCTCSLPLYAFLTTVHLAEIQRFDWSCLPRLPYSVSNMSLSAAAVSKGVVAYG